MTLRPASVLAAVLALAAVTSSCARKSDSAGVASTEAAPPSGAPTTAEPAVADGAPAKPPGLFPSQPAAATPRKVIRNGVLELTVDRYQEAQQALEGLIAAAGGIIDSTNVTHQYGAVTQAVLVIRVPSEGFSALLPRVRQLGEVVHETTDAEDITAQYVDLGARRDNAMALEKRLLELVAGRAAQMSELLEVERELARVRGEVEQLEGQLRLWNDQVSLSTLRLTIYTREQVRTAASSRSFLGQVEDAMDSSAHALRDAMIALALALASLLPWAPVLVPVALLVRRLWRRPLPAAQAIRASVVASGAAGGAAGGAGATGDASSGAVSGAPGAAGEGATAADAGPKTA